MKRWRSIAFVFALLFSPALASAQIKELASREYKIGLAAGRLPAAPEEALTLIRRRLGAFEHIQIAKERHAQVQFLDTDQCTLARHSMLLRTRTRPAKLPRITLKVRNYDILYVDSIPVQSINHRPVPIEDDYSFRGPGRAASNFSKSFSFDGAIPDRLDQLTRHILHLEQVFPGTLRQRLQGGPRVNETVYLVRPIAMANGQRIELEISLWYHEPGKPPLAGDISFTLTAPYTYGMLQSADQMLSTLAQSLGELKAEAGEKALAIIPDACRP